MDDDFSDLVKKHEPAHAQKRSIEAARDHGNFEPLMVAFRKREKWTHDDEEAHGLIISHIDGEGKKRGAKGKAELKKKCVELVFFYHGYYGGELQEYNDGDSWETCSGLVADRLGIPNKGRVRGYVQDHKKDNAEEASLEGNLRGQYARLYDDELLPEDCVFPQFRDAIRLQREITDGEHYRSTTLLEGAIKQAISTGHLRANCEPHEFVRNYCRIEKETSGARPAKTNKPIADGLERYAKAMEFTTEEYAPGNPYPASSPLHELLNLRF